MDLGVRSGKETGIYGSDKEFPNKRSIFLVLMRTRFTSQMKSGMISLTAS